MFDEYYRWTWGPVDISYQQTQFATDLRVPILSSSHPRWNYVSGIVVCDDICDHGIMPTDDEIEQVAAHLADYRLYYRESFIKAMENLAPYDIDGGANLGYYMKRPHGGWCYRKRTWYSPNWWPRDKSVILPLSHVLARNFNGWSFAKTTA